MRLALPDVTLCAVTCINHELTVRSMLKCLEQCSFADVVLLTIVLDSRRKEPMGQGFW